MRPPYSTVKPQLTHSLLMPAKLSTNSWSETPKTWTSASSLWPSRTTNSFQLALHPTLSSRPPFCCFPLLFLYFSVIKRLQGLPACWSKFLIYNKHASNVMNERFIWPDWLKYMGITMNWVTRVKISFRYCRNRHRAASSNHHLSPASVHQLKWEGIINAAYWMAYRLGTQGPTNYEYR